MSSSKRLTTPERGTDRGDRAARDGSELVAAETWDEDRTTLPIPALNASIAGRLLCGKWRVERLLGVGGMSAVYEARHRNGNRVAVKVLKPELASNDAIRTRFLREGYMANRVGHQAAAVVLDDDESDGLFFLVMELIEGESLEAYCQRAGGRLSSSRVIELSEQLLEVIAAAHANGVIHRDVKPANVFVTRAGRVKLLDFGIAALREGNSSLSHTSSGAMLGTPAFMSPEQARGRHSEVDARTDVWAIGATMFRMLAGRLVHACATAEETLIATATQPAPSLAKVCPEAHRGLAEVVDRALQMDREQRFPTAAAMLAAVRSVASAEHEGPAAVVPAVPRRNRRRLILAMAAGALSAGIVFRVWDRSPDLRPQTEQAPAINAGGAKASAPVGPATLAPSSWPSAASTGAVSQPVSTAPPNSSVGRSATAKAPLPPARRKVNARPPVDSAWPVSSSPASASSSQALDVERILENRR